MWRGLVALALCALGSATPRDALADDPLPPSEYRLWAGVRHPGELLTADVLTAGRLALRGVDSLESSVLPGDDAGAVALRLGAFGAVDLPIVSYAIVIPHEAFGHAARFREFDGRPRVVLDLPLPYSFDAAHHVESRPARRLYDGEQSIATLGGLAAQEASQRILASTTFRSGVLRRGEAVLYAATSLTHAAQTLAGRDVEVASSYAAPLYGDDARSYRTLVRTALLLDLLDPMLVYSWYASSARWLVRGETSTAAPSLKLAGARFLATSRTQPVPWGVEHELHLLAAASLASFDLGIRTGLGSRGSFGLDLATFDWRLLEVMRAGAELAFWTQPVVTAEATLGPPATVIGAVSVSDATTTGGAVRVHLEVDRPSWFLGTRLGWKSVGLWGERELAEGYEVALTGGAKL